MKIFGGFQEVLLRGSCYSQIVVGKSILRIDRDGLVEPVDCLLYFTFLNQFVRAIEFLAGATGNGKV